MASDKQSGGNIATVAGGGGAGGILVFLASNYLTPPLQDIVLYLSPTIGILVGGVFAYFQNSIKDWGADQSIRAELEKAKRHLSKIENDNNSTPAHREQARKQVETLEMLVFRIHDKRIKASMEAS